MELAGFRVFLDLKLHDIPHQVALAVAAVAKLRVEIVTVHATGGAAMLQAAVAAAKKRTRVVGVTLLTSLDERDLVADGIGDGPGAVVARRLALCAAAGLDGVVLSGHELVHARDLPAAMLRIVPGVRPTAQELGDDHAAPASDDQRRTVPVHDAIAAGADLIVIGRPIAQAADPRKAAQSVLAAIAAAHAQRQV
jgi:orotidine-5'-phosphate decarboxylase